ncbi:hypothetical protein GCM10009631_07600 [Corynebacterium glaucum]
MGRRGGKKAAQLWETDPDGDYAQSRREALDAAHAKREISSELLGTRMRMLFLEAKVLGASFKRLGEMLDMFLTERRYPAGGVAGSQTGPHGACESTSLQDGQGSSRQLTSFV